MRVVPLRPEHLAALRPGAPERPAPSALEPGALLRGANGPAFSIVAEGRVLGVLGLVLDGRDGWAWALFSDALRARPAPSPCTGPSGGCSSGSSAPDWSTASTAPCGPTTPPVIAGSPGSASRRRAKSPSPTEP